MITRWGANIEKDKVLLEYPRPQMRRGSYINLNGMWQYAIVRGESLPDKIDGEILVPFSPECELSGVHRTVGPAWLCSGRFWRPEGLLQVCAR